MTTDQYSELIDFLGKRFTHMDRRFDGLEVRMDRFEERMDRLEERMDRLEERMERLELRLTRSEIQGEENRDRIRILAEAMTGFQEAMNRRFQEMDRKIDDLRDLMVLGHQDLSDRVSRLEARVGLV